MEELGNISYQVLALSFPLILAGIFHMIVVKFDLFSPWKIPISAIYFGKNKTYRGFVLFPLLTYFSLVLTRWLDLFTDFYIKLTANSQMIEYGLLLGLFYMIGELPNSFMKRRHGIPPGKLHSDKRKRIIFLLFDQVDSAFFCLTYGIIFFDLSWSVLFVGVILGFLIHLSVNITLYMLKLRTSPF